jgi:hypothetical protein
VMLSVEAGNDLDVDPSTPSSLLPTILTTVSEERGGMIFKQVQAVFPDQKTINRTFINCWEDRRVVEAVKKTGRKKLCGCATH